MTKALLRSSKKLKRYYCASLNLSKDDDKYRKNIRYQNVFNVVKRYAHESYYKHWLVDHSTYAHKPWQVLKELINKSHDKINVVDKIMVNGMLLQDKSEKCNAFNKHFSGIGNERKSKYKFTTKSFTDYLWKLNTKSLVFGAITEIEITSITKSLKMKSSFELDQTSNRLVKSLTYTNCLLW